MEQSQHTPGGVEGLRGGGISAQIPRSPGRTLFLNLNDARYGSLLWLTSQLSITEDRVKPNDRKINKRRGSLCDMYC